MTSDEYIAWAATTCPVVPSETKAPFAVAWAEYDSVDARLGDLADGDDFLSRVLWLEITLRVHRLGWTVEEVESARWPVRNTARVRNVLRSL